jgi:hypothetical protein
MLKSFIKVIESNPVWLTKPHRNVGLFLLGSSGDRASRFYRGGKGKVIEHR